MTEPHRLARLLSAVAFAAERHREQRRADIGASPYINHPIEVAHLLADEGGIDDLVVLQAAVLHDTLEDTATTVTDLIERFGQQVARLVLEVTDDTALPREQRKAEQIRRAATCGYEAALVKLADKTANLRDLARAPPPGWSPKRRCDYFDFAKQVVDALPRVDTRLHNAFEAAYAQRRQIGAGPQS